MTRRAVIEGASLAGLALALRLRNQGFEVTVVEASDGFGAPFNGECELITLPAAYRDLFIKTGAPLEEVLELEPLETPRRFIFADCTALDAPGVGNAAFANALTRLCGTETGVQWKKYMLDASRMWEVIRQDVLHTSLASRREYSTLLRTRRAMRLAMPWSTARAALKKTLRQPKAQELAQTYALFAGVDPRVSSELVSTLMYAEQEFGVWKVAGGSHRIAEALKQRCDERGVRCCFAAEIVEIAALDGQYELTLSSGEPITATVFVSSLETTSRHGRVGGFRICLELSEALQLPTPEVVYLSPELDKHLDALFSARPHLPEAPTVRVSRCSQHPDDAQRLDVVVPVSLDLEWPAELPQSFATSVIRYLGERGLELESGLVHMEARPPSTPLRGITAGFSRKHWPVPNRAEQPGRYFVGTEAHPSGGAEHALMSAEIVADLVKQDLPRTKR